MRPVQLIGVGVIVAVFVGRGVLLGVNVIAGGCVFGGFTGGWVLTGGEVIVNVGAKITLVDVAVLEGVLVSPAKPVGSADPRIGTPTKKVRALDETIVSGSIGMTGTIGS